MQIRLRNSGERTIGYIKETQNRRYRPWWNEDIKRLRKQRKAALRELKRLEKRREEGERIEDREVRLAEDRYNQKKQETRESIQEAIIKEEKRKVEELRRRKDNREWWQYMKGPPLRKEKEEIKLIIGGQTTEEETRIKEHIKEYWERIGGMEERRQEGRELKVEMEHHQIAEKQNYEISRRDIEAYIKKLKNLKAVGPDGIPNEFYK